MIRRIAEIIPERRVDPKKLGWLSGKRAETRANFPANFEYVDLRGFTLADLAAELDFEEAAYRDLELKGFSQASIDEIDRKQSTASAAPIVDFGVASAVVALSAFGCIPVTSCRGERKNPGQTDAVSGTSLLSATREGGHGMGAQARGQKRLGRSRDDRSGQA
jgi:hypothetical protein